MHKRVTIRSEAEAAKWYIRAAEQGHTRAQYTIGAMYLYGEGVIFNKKEAEKWLRKAAQNGHAKAQMELTAMQGSAPPPPATPQGQK